MPYAIISSQAPITARPQTSRAARHAFNKRKVTGPSERDLKRIAREEKQEQLTAKKRKREAKKKQNERKRAEEKEKEKERVKQLGVEQVVKVPEGQMRIAGFFKAPTTTTKGIKKGTEQDVQKKQRLPVDQEEVKEAKLSQDPDALSVATDTETLVGNATCVEQEEGDEVCADGEVHSNTTCLESESNATAVAKPSPSTSQAAHQSSRRTPKTPALQLPQQTSASVLDSTRMPPPAAKIVKKSITTTGGTSYNTPHPILEASVSSAKEESLGLSSSNIDLPKTLKRKTADIDDDWADFFQSNTQVARELSDVAPPRPFKPRRATVTSSTPAFKRRQGRDYLTKSPYPLQKVCSDAPTQPLHYASLARPQSPKPVLTRPYGEAVPTKAACRRSTEYQPVKSRQPRPAGHPQIHHTSLQRGELVPNSRRIPSNARGKSTTVKTSALEPPPKPIIQPEPDLEDFLAGISTQEFFDIPTSPVERFHATKLGQKSQPNRTAEKRQEQYGQEPKGEQLKSRVLGHEQNVAANLPSDFFDFGGISSQELAELPPI